MIHHVYPSVLKIQWVYWNVSTLNEINLVIKKTFVHYIVKLGTFFKDKILSFTIFLTVGLKKK